MNRRDFLKGIGITALATIAGRPVYDSLLRQEYHLTTSLNDNLSKYIRLESMKMFGGSVNCTVSIDKRWVQECINVTDQYNRPWEIIGYFEGLRNPEGQTFPLDRLNS